MTPLVIDASVAIKWFIPEPGSINALKLLDDGRDMLAPDLIVPECGNVLWKRWLTGELESDVIAAILTDLGRMNLRIVPAGVLVEEASRIAVTWRRSFYDSVYLALAVVSGGRLITADKKLCNALTGTSLQESVIFLGDTVT